MKTSHFAFAPILATLAMSLSLAASTAEASLKPTGTIACATTDDTDIQVTVDFDRMEFTAANGPASLTTPLRYPKHEVELRRDLRVFEVFSAELKNGATIEFRFEANSETPGEGQLLSALTGDVEQTYGLCTRTE